MLAFHIIPEERQGMHTQGCACAAVLSALENILILFDSIPRFASVNMSF